MKPAWTDEVSAIASIVAAGGAVIAAIFVPITTFYRRPSLSLDEDAAHTLSRVEGEGFPYVRLVVRNKGWRRKARRTQVLVARHQEQRAGSPVVTMGSPALHWTSVFGEDDVIDLFAGSERPIDFGWLLPVGHTSGELDARSLDADTLPKPRLGGQELPALVFPNPKAANFRAGGDRWFLRFALARGLEIKDQREYLPPTLDGYVVRLEVGADDGKARKYDVYVNWDGSASDAESALKSVQLEVLGA